MEIHVGDNPKYNRFSQAIDRLASLTKRPVGLEADNPAIGALVLSAVRRIPESDVDLWHDLAIVIARSRPDEAGLIAALERRLMDWRDGNAASKARLYLIFSILGVSFDPGAILSDDEMRDAAPVIWFDLALPAANSPDIVRRMLIAAIHTGKFDVNHLSGRLEIAISAGSDDIGTWIAELRDAFPEKDREKVEALLIACTGAIAA